ncbi:MAG: prolipoprotein diacylglyceryl transferase, partial [Steroidobacteraceae bacterium]
TWTGADVDDLIFWAMLGVILGGRIGYVLFYGLPFWSEDPLYPLKIWQGGMSFHGALIGVLVAIALFGVRRKRHVLDVMDFTAPLPGLGIMAGRIGNFINGELWGRPTTASWGFLVPGGNGEPDSVRHASQLYESLLEGLLMFILVWWFSAQPRARGAVFGLGLVYYGTVRFLAEFLRVPDAQLGYLAGGWFTMGQLLSVPMLIGGVALLYRAATSPQSSGNFRST